MGTSPWTVSPSGIVLSVRLTPRGGRDAIEGTETLSDGRAVLKARVRALASEGEANAALVKLVARALDVPARDVALVGGATSRVKRLAIAGNAAALVPRLEKIAAPR